jgi:hypothetical protein
MVADELLHPKHSRFQHETLVIYLLRTHMLLLSLQGSQSVCCGVCGSSTCCLMCCSSCTKQGTCSVAAPPVQQAFAAYRWRILDLLHPISSTQQQLAQQPPCDPRQRQQAKQQRESSRRPVVSAARGLILQQQH